MAMAADINYDRTGEPTYDQWAVGEDEEEFLYMSRDLDDLLECERSPANVVLGRAEIADEYDADLAPFPRMR